MNIWTPEIQCHLASSLALTMKARLTDRIPIDVLLFCNIENQQTLKKFAIFADHTNAWSEPRMKKPRV